MPITLSPEHVKRPDEAADEHEMFYAKQVRQLYENAPIGFLATLINSSILVFVLRKVVPPQFLIIWLVCIVTITALRYKELRRLRHALSDPAETRRLGSRFLAGMTLSGIAWGSASILLFPSESIIHQTFLAFVLGGMVAGAAATYSIQMKVFLSYSVPALAPIIIRFIAAGDEIHMAMGGMALLYALMIFFVAFRVNSMTIASLKLGFENSGLVAYLASAKEDAEKLNRELMLEIDERTKAERELKEHREHLEDIVEERTREWGKANAELQQEIIERTRAEGVIRESEQRFRNLVEVTSDWIWEVNEEFVYTYVSPQVYHILGYEPSEILGKTPFDLMPQEEADLVRNRVRQIVAERRPFQAVENPTRHKDGHLVTLETGAVPVFGPDGEFRGYRGIDRDITRRKEMEADILKVQKIESIGLLAGGIAHDFNNLLTGILGNISLAKEILSPEDKICKNLEEAEKASRRARALTQQLLIFSRGGGPVKQVASASQVVVDSAQFAVRGSNVRCEFSIPGDIWPVEIDEGQISQVIHNLVINAHQAMPEGGVITLSVWNTIVTAEDPLPLQGGRYVAISVEDRGIGIPEEHLSKVFDPYFSTKEEGRGLGLATSYSIIKNHGGHLSVESKLGHGTIFRLYLPATEKGLPLRRAEEGRLFTNRGKILIMDDEEMIRDVAFDILSYMGYDVEVSREGAEAIEMYRSAKESGEPFSAVILDLTIPGGMGGGEVIKRLYEIDPEVKAIVSSGYSDDPIMANFRGYGFRAVVAKPYSIRDLSQVLHEVIEMKDDQV